MNIYNYIDKNKDITFEEKDLTDIDAMIFSYLSYAEFSKVLSKYSKITLERAATLHKKRYPKKTNDILAIREANDLLRYLKDKKRYKDCLLYNYEFLETEEVQFSAITIEYKKNHVFVSFEGTNAHMSGWREDLLLSCEFPTLSHNLAIDYLNNRFTLSRKKLIIGGHSKGGNLALVASMYANPLVKHKINKIYNGDGPGLLKEQFASSKYESIKDRYIHFLTDYSVVGILLSSTNNYIVRSKAKNIYAHDLLEWQILDDSFIESNLSSFSKNLEQEISNWVDNTTKDEKRELIKNLDLVIKKAKIQSLKELKASKIKIFSIIYNSKEMNDSSKKILRGFIKILFKSLEMSTKEEIQLFFNKTFNRKKKEESVN